MHEKEQRAISLMIASFLAGLVTMSGFWMIGLTVWNYLQSQLDTTVSEEVLR
jgi:hypothetical protein